jgi:hypothetical protein
MGRKVETAYGQAISLTLVLGIFALIVFMVWSVIGGILSITLGDLLVWGAVFGIGYVIGRAAR